MSLVVGRRMSRALWAGATLALALGVSAQAWAKAADDPCPRIGGSVTQRPIQSSIRAILDNANADASLLGGASHDCDAMGPNSLTGRMCMGEAQRRLGDLARHNGGDAVGAYRASRDAYCRAVGLAQNANAMTVEANTGLAETLVTLAIVDPGSAAAHNALLRRAHGVAGARGSDDVHRAIVQLLISENNTRGALDEVAHIQRSENRALALVDIAIKQQSLPGLGDPNETLRRAQQEQGNSPLVNAAIGRGYFKAGDRDRARAALVLATSSGALPSGYESVRDDAFYYLSVIEMDTNGARAATLSDSAGSSVYGLRQACLTRVKLGGQAVFAPQRDTHGNLVRQGGDIVENATDGASACKRLGSSPDSQLALGMYWLRRAQSLPPPTLGTADERLYRRSVDEAAAAFRTQVDDPNTPVTWDAPGGAKPTMRDALQFGQQMASDFQGFCRGGGHANNSAAYALFRYYNVAGCTP